MVARRLASPKQVANNAFDAKKKDAVLVLVELVEFMLANTNMNASHFSSDVKDAFLSIKVIADRLRS